MTFLFYSVVSLDMFFHPGISSKAFAQSPVTTEKRSSRIIVVDDDSYAPFAFLDDQGKPAGITVDIWKLWSKKSGIAVEFHLMSWDSALKAVQNGKADAIGSLFKTPKRQDKFTFLKPLFPITTGIFFHKRITGVKGLEDLQGFPIGVVKGDSSEELILQQDPHAILLTYPGTEALVKGAAHGEVNVFVADSKVARFYLAKLDRDSFFREGSRPIAVNWVYVGIKKGNTPIQSILQEGFRQISAKDIQSIHDAWAGKPLWSRISRLEMQTLAAFLIIILILIVVWNVSLRKKVGRTLVDIEQRNRALLESEARFKAFFNLAPFSCTVIDLNGRFQMVNQAFCRDIGLQESDIVGHTGQELGITTDGDIIQTVLAELLQTGEVTSREVQVGPAERLRHVIFSSRLIQEGAERLVLSTTVDITARKQAENALKEGESKFMRLFESAPLPMAFASETDDFWTTTWNESWFVTFGYRREEDQGRSGNEIGIWVDPEDRKRFIDMIKTQHRNVRFEALLRRHDGNIRRCELYGCFIGKVGQQILMAAYVDITDQKQAEMAMRESEERFSKAFSSSPAPLSISDIETGRFIDVNDQWMKMLGHTRQDAIGHTSFELKIWKDPEIRLKMREELKKTGSFKDVQIEFIKKSGELRDVLWSAEIINLAGAKVMLSLFYDFTERKKAEDEKSKLQSQLLQSQKMEAVGRLAGGLAHDYNNMLGVIVGHTELAMLKSGENNHIQNHLSEVITAAKRSADLTQQLLAFARRQTIAPKVIEVNAAITATHRMLLRLIGEEITLTWLPGTGTYRVRMDPIQLDQLLINLSVNARDAINGVGRITIETQWISIDKDARHAKPEMIPGNYVAIIVSDDGVGMDEQTRDKIFEPFFTTKQIGRGTGMGLATVYGIVKQNNGFINVYSEPDRGTTFKIYLPICTGLVAEKREDSGNIPESQGETVLIVEDEPVLLESTSAMLKSLGYKVLTAGTPVEAIRLGEKHAGGIDLLLTDVVMPEMNGRELEQQILKRNPHIKCLFTSGYTANVISHHGVLEADVQFIQKPFTLTSLARKIRESIGPKSEATF